MAADQYFTEITLRLPAHVADEWRRLSAVHNRVSAEARAAAAIALFADLPVDIREAISLVAQTVIAREGLIDGRLLFRVLDSSDTPML